MDILELVKSEPAYIIAFIYATEKVLGIEIIKDKLKRKDAKEKYEKLQEKIKKLEMKNTKES